MKQVIAILLLAIATIWAKETVAVDSRTGWKPSFEASNSFKNALQQFSKEIQSISVEEFEKFEEGASITDGLKKASEEVVEISQHVQNIMRKIPGELKNFMAREIKEDVADFSKRWKEMNLKVGEVTKEAANKMATWKSAAQKKIADLSKTSEVNQAKWDKYRENILNKLAEVEKTLETDLKGFQDQWSSFFNKMEHHMNHKPHHPTIQCGKCGEKFTLHQFMEMVKDRGYFIQEEAFWTGISHFPCNFIDEELEEFYEGWGVWANRSAVHCPKCGAVQWKDVEFVSDVEEKEIENKKEEL